MKEIKEEQILLMLKKLPGEGNQHGVGCIWGTGQDNLQKYPV